MNLADSMTIWRNVLTQPSEATLEAEKENPNATMTTAIIWVVAAALINFIAQAITFLFFNPVQDFIDVYTEFLTASGTSDAITEEFLAQLASDSFTNNLLLGLFLGVILLPIFFLIGSGILWVIARALGGDGDFAEQTYLISTYYTPLRIINVIASFIPLIGLIISLAILGYQFMLTYFVLRVTHHLTPGKAIGTILAPMIGLFAFSCCCSFLMVSSLASLAA